MSDKSQHAQCIIERYRRELSDKYTRLYAAYNNRDPDFGMRWYYCFPYLYSALFYDPTPDQIRFIGHQAQQLEMRNWHIFLFAEKLMRLAPPETGEVDFEKWIVKNDPGGDYSYYRYLLIFGSAHPDGYFREQCLKRFVDDDLRDMIGYTLIRLNDRVPEIRRTAQKVFYELMRKERAAGDLVKAMPYVEHVRKGQRAKRSENFSMDMIDAYIMETFERNPDTVLEAYIPARRLCYKVFSLHPEPRYSSLVMYFFRNERSPEMRCMLAQIYMKMSGNFISDEALAIFSDDKNDRVRLIAYEYRYKKEGLWEGFEKLLFSDSCHIRRFARRILEKTEFEILKFCRNNLPQSLPEFANSGTKEDIPLIRPYLEQYPREAMYALVKIGAEDSKDIILKNLNSNDPVLAKAAFRIAAKVLKFDHDELKKMIRSETDSMVQWKLIMLLVKDGVWKVMPDLLRYLRDFPEQRRNLLQLLQYKTGYPVYVKMEFNREVRNALAYVRETYAIPYYINDQICRDMMILL